MNTEQDKFVPKQIRDFLNYASVIKGLSKLTTKGYEYDLILFARYVIAYEDSPEDIYAVDLKKFNITTIKKITLEDIYGFLSFAEDARNNSASTRARKVSALRSFFKYLTTKANILKKDITIDLEKPKIPKTVPKYLSVTEVEILLAYVEGRNVIRDRCILVVFLSTGIRLSELCGIDLSDIKDNSLVVTGKGNKQRTVPLSKRCMLEIRDYLEHYRFKKLNIMNEEQALFISERKQRINKRTVEHVMQRAIKSSNLSTDYSVHKLRHTAATMLYRAGADIRSLQALLGHEKLDTTQIYTHVDDDELKNIVELNPLKF